MINNTAATSGAGSTYPSGSPKLQFKWGMFGVAQSLVICVVFYISLIVLLLSFV